MSIVKKYSTGQRLRQERERHNYSQEHLAELIGATALSINRWEHDKTLPRPAFRAALCRVFNMSAGVLFGLDEGEEQATTGPTIWNVPHLRNLYFTGREQILEYLHATLGRKKTVALTQASAISGLGGIGKTQVAVEYAYRYGSRYQAILWVNADTHKSLVSDFVALAGLLDLPEKNAADQRRAVDAVIRWLQGHSQWLLILDNADDLEMVYDFLPARGAGHTLLTSRSQATGPNIKGIELERMEREEGTLFLLRRAKILAEDAPLECASDKYRKEAGMIWELVDGLPLALDQAAAYIEEHNCCFADYLSLYQTRRGDLLKWRGALSKRDYPKSVATTWSLSFEQVERTDSVAANVLRLCAFLHPDAIPEAMLLEGAAALAPGLQDIAADRMRFEEAIAALRKYSLVRRNSETKVLTIHRLVQTVLKEGMEKDKQREWAERAVRAVDAAFPEVELVEAWQQCQQYLPHAQTCADLIEQWEMMLPEAARLLHRTGNYLYERGQYREAEPLYRRAVFIREQALGPDHPDVARSLSDLALLYLGRGEYEQAEPLYRRALIIQERALGPDHPDVAGILNDLAMLYYFQGQYEQAEPFHQRARIIFECALGPTHHNVATSLNNLGKLYLAQGRYESARTLMQRALAMREQAQGLDHPDVANSLHHLGDLAAAEGKYNEAEELYQRALTMREQSLGVIHPNVAETLHEWAKLCHAQGRDEEAEALFQRALAIREQVLGAKHPALAATLEAYADLLRKTGREAEAGSLEERARTRLERD
jgi:tetratricopeptide (TPR) repeat protein/transcriptional regulator with XRE-family HTH domain